MRDRLIKELDSAYLFLRNRATSSPAPLNEYDIDAMLDIAKICDESARALEKAIIPPVKVGDTIFYLNRCVTAEDYGKQYVDFGKVNQISKNRHGEWVYLDTGYLFAFDYFGKTVFLSREEAEQKLKEGKG